jgi:hypothetical protein
LEAAVFLPRLQSEVLRGADYQRMLAACSLVQTAARAIRF